MRKEINLPLRTVPMLFGCLLFTSSLVAADLPEGSSVRTMCAVRMQDRHPFLIYEMGSEFKQLKVPAAIHQQSTLNPQLPQTKPAGKWIERFEEWLADSGVFEKAVNVKYREEKL